MIYGAGDIRVKDVPDARLIEPGDALVRVTRLLPLVTERPSSAFLDLVCRLAEQRTVGDIGSRRGRQRGGAIIVRSHGAVVTDIWRPRTDGSEQLGESHD